VRAGAPELRALLAGRAAAARDLGGWPAARPLTLRAVMRTGVLGGQPVHFRSHTGDLLLSGARPCRVPQLAARAAASLSCRAALAVFSPSRPSQAAAFLR